MEIRRKFPKRLLLGATLTAAASEEGAVADPTPDQYTAGRRRVSNLDKEIDKDMNSSDPLEFEDTKKYTERLDASQNKTGLGDAIRVAHGKINGESIVICCMDFSFIGGSMGAVVGEKIARGVDLCEAGVGKESTFLMDFPLCSGIGAHRIGRKKIYIPIAS